MHRTLQRLRSAALAALALLPALPAPAASAPQTPLFRAMNVEDALSLAEKEEKLVLLVFTRPGSDEARKMSVDTWANSRVQQWIRDRTVALRLDLDWQPVLSSRYEVTQVPTSIFLDAKNEELERITGPCDAATFLERARHADGGDGPQGAARGAAAEHPDDLRARVQLAEAMTAAGRHTAALQEMLSAFDDFADDESWGIERRSVLVPRILAMQRVAPRARVELITRRNRLEATVLGQPDVSPGRAGDLAALNRHLGEIDRTLLVWDKLSAQRHDTAAVRGALFPGAAEALLDQERYEEVLAASTDVDARIEALRARLEALGDVDHTDPVRLSLVDRVQKRALWHFHALLGAGELEAAQRRADWLLAFDGGERTYVLLMKHAAAAGAVAEAERLASQAMQRLPEDQLQRVHATLNEITGG